MSKRKNSLSSLAKTMKNVDKAMKGKTSAKTQGKQVLRQLGVIKPQKRTGLAAALRKLSK